MVTMGLTISHLCTRSSPPVAPVVLVDSLGQAMQLFCLGVLVVRCDRHQIGADM